MNGIQLADYAKAQIGRPYWYGTFGQIANTKLLAEKAKQYPKQYSAARQQKAKDRGDIGQKVHDCVGLYKGALWSKGPDMPAEYHAAQDISADGAFKNATEKGPIGSMPEIRGLGVYRKGHVGIYIGGGRVVQAKGFDYGVIESDTEGFTDWFKYPDVDYTDCEIVSPNPEPVPEPAADPEPAPEGKIYTVVAGDTLTKIANACDPKTTAAELGRINGIENLDLIQIGQQIRLPAGTEIAAAPEVWIGIVNTVKDPLNVRSGRGTQYPIVMENGKSKQLPKGSMVEIRGEAQNGWHELADGSGFVSANFIVK